MPFIGSDPCDRYAKYTKEDTIISQVLKMPLQNKQYIYLYLTTNELHITSDTILQCIVIFSSILLHLHIFTVKLKNNNLQNTRILQGTIFK